MIWIKTQPAYGHNGLHQVYNKPSKDLGFQTVTAEALRSSDQKQDYHLRNMTLKYDRDIH
jgi:hypothetical protein